MIAKHRETDVIRKHFGKAYLREIVKTLVAKIAHIPLKHLEPVLDEPAVPLHAIRLLRLKPLINQVKQIGEGMYYKMPESFQVLYSREDWIQDAMRILLECAPRYNPHKSPSFNAYIIALVEKRLISIQRALFRKNPTVNDQVRNVAKAFKQQHGREPSLKELAETLDCREEHVLQVLGERTVSEISEETPMTDTRGSPSQEKGLPKGYILSILHDYLNQLDPSLKQLFILHEFEGISFQQLFLTFGHVFESDSQSTFQRQYKKHVFNPAKEAVQKHYTIHSIQ